MGEVKKGLILEGGALKGIFSCGVIDVLMENARFVLVTLHVLTQFLISILLASIANKLRTLFPDTVPAKWIFSKVDSSIKLNIGAVAPSKVIVWSLPSKFPLNGLYQSGLSL